MHSMILAKTPQATGLANLSLGMGLIECEKIKNEFGLVARDYDAEMKQANEANSTMERKYSLPGGHIVTVREERLKCPELLFAPTLV